jgi:hypothetical protein
MAMTKPKPLRRRAMMKVKPNKIPYTPEMVRVTQDVTAERVADYIERWWFSDMSDTARPFPISSLLKNIRKGLWRA